MNDLTKIDRMYVANYDEKTPVITSPLIKIKKTREDNSEVQRADNYQINAATIRVVIYSSSS